MTPKQPLMQTWGAVIISTIILLTFASAVVLAWLGKLPSTNNVTLLLGALISMAMAVVQFWTGSSSGSKIKDAQIARQSDQLSTSVPVSWGNPPVLSATPKAPIQPTP